MGSVTSSESVPRPDPRRAAVRQDRQSSPIVIDEVTKRYPDGTEAVRGVSFAVAAGELVVLVGPSGCGKSTLLRMVAGLEEISSGRVLIDDATVNDVDAKDRDLAMVFQDYALYAHMTVRKNIEFPLRMARLPKAEIARRVADIAEVLALSAHLDRKPRALSGGQRQRVAMGRAMVRRPRALLLDEPLSNLDASLRVELRTEILDVKRRLGPTMLYVTHDQTEAMTLGDRIVVMRDGVIEQIGPPSEVYAQPATLFVASFIGSPPMNFLRADDDDATYGGSTVVLGVRPERLWNAATSRPGPSALTFSGRIEIVERLGSDTFVHVRHRRSETLNDAPALRDLQRSGAKQRNRAGILIARLPASADVNTGQDIHLWCPPEMVNVFDQNTGRRTDIAGAGTSAKPPLVTGSAGAAPRGGDPW